MSQDRSLTVRIFAGIWSALNFLRKAVLNIFVLGIALVVGIAIFSGDKKMTVPTDSALVLNLSGDLVIEKTAIDPFEQFMEEAFSEKEDNPEILLQDVLFAIQNAKEDKRIKVLILDLQGLRNAGLDKLRQVAQAIDDFKDSDKPVYALGDYYSQTQYYLAAHADHVYLNPEGIMILEGYGTYPLYMKSALEKLKAKTHVFRVGTYKSAVEPYIRDDMSEQAKQANQEWLSAMWQQYKADIAEARNMDMANFDEKLAVFMQKLESAGGSFARYALDNGWVDALKPRHEIRDELAAILAKGEKDAPYASISYKNYLKVIRPPFPLLNKDIDKVGVVVARGTIFNGEQRAGKVGGDSTAALLRKARMNDSVKAVVLYVDSPGGSAFASERIRQEIEQLKLAGKPVIAAMSSVAASGGYMISVSADEIWASPSTITGSIGVFGMFMTYEDSLATLGLHSDGVGTTEFAGLSLARELDPMFANIVQRSVEYTYQQFINLVANERGMTPEQVDAIAQGRVWIGEKAIELGLVDHLGDLEDAVSAAAARAELDTYDSLYIKPELSAEEKFLQELFNSASVTLVKTQLSQSSSPLIGMIKQLLGEFDELSRMNDPKGVYNYCLTCRYQ